MTSCDVLILGAGASGLMCAATAAERKKKVVVLDHTTLPARKVLASGGAAEISPTSSRT
jgi:predicted flavoprotein YhiN